MDWGVWKEVKLWAVRETSKAVMLMLIPPPSPTGGWHSAHQAYCTGLRPFWTPIVLYKCRSYLPTSAGISQCTLHCFYCSVNWQQCRIIVPLGLIQCAFGYQCHSFYFKQQFSLPFPLKDSWWFSCTCLSIAQRYFPNLVKWDLGTSGHKWLYIQLRHSIFFLWFERRSNFRALFHQGCLSKRQQSLQWHRTSVFTTAFMLS